MNCLEVRRHLNESSSYAKLGRAVQQHVESCVECQGAYPTRSSLKSFFDAMPEVEPDRRLLAAVRQSIDREMDRRAWGLFDLIPSLSFAGGVAALLAVMALPMLWLGTNEVPARAASVATVAQRESLPVQVQLVGPFTQAANPLVVADPLVSLSRSYEPQIQPGSVVHVIYPFKTEKKPDSQRAVVHY